MSWIVLSAKCSELEKSEHDLHPVIQALMPSTTLRISSTTRRMLSPSNKPTTKWDRLTVKHRPTEKMLKCQNSRAMSSSQWFGDKGSKRLFWLVNIQINFIIWFWRGQYYLFCNVHCKILGKFCFSYYLYLFIFVFSVILWLNYCYFLKNDVCLFSSRFQFQLF